MDAADRAALAAKLSDRDNVEMMASGLIWVEAQGRWTDPGWLALIEGMSASERLSLFREIQERKP